MTVAASPASISTVTYTPLEQSTFTSTYTLSVASVSTQTTTLISVSTHTPPSTAVLVSTQLTTLISPSVSISTQLPPSVSTTTETVGSTHSSVPSNSPDDQTPSVNASDPTPLPDCVQDALSENHLGVYISQSWFTVRISTIESLQIGISTENVMLMETGYVFGDTTTIFPACGVTTIATFAKAATKPSATTSPSLVASQKQSSRTLSPTTVLSTVLTKIVTTSCQGLEHGHCVDVHITLTSESVVSVITSVMQRDLASATTTHPAGTAIPQMTILSTLSRAETSKVSELRPRHRHSFPTTGSGEPSHRHKTKSWMVGPPISASRPASAPNNDVDERFVTPCATLLCALHPQLCNYLLSSSEILGDSTFTDFDGNSHTLIPGQVVTLKTLARRANAAAANATPTPSTDPDLWIPSDEGGPN
jgi:hypothetical protein